MSMLFVEDVIDHRVLKRREQAKRDAKRVKQMFRAAQDTARSERDEAWRNRRLAKQIFAHA